MKWRISKQYIVFCNRNLIKFFCCNYVTLIRCCLIVIEYGIDFQNTLNIVVSRNGFMIELVRFLCGLTYITVWYGYRKLLLMLSPRLIVIIDY